MNMYIFYSISKAEIYIPLFLNIAPNILAPQVIKSLKHDNINNLCLCLKYEQTYRNILPRTFQTTEFLRPKIKT